MITIKKLRLNDFKEVFIPCKKDLYQKYGFRRCECKGGTRDPNKFAATPENVAAMMSTTQCISAGARLIAYDKELQRRQAEAAREAERAAAAANNSASAAADPVQ